VADPPLSQDVCDLRVRSHVAEFPGAGHLPCCCRLSPAGTQARGYCQYDHRTRLTARSHDFTAHVTASRSTTLASSFAFSSLPLRKLQTTGYAAVDPRPGCPPAISVSPPFWLLTHTSSRTYSDILRFCTPTTLSRRLREGMAAEAAYPHYLEQAYSYCLAAAEPRRVWFAQCHACPSEMRSNEKSRCIRTYASRAPRCSCPSKITCKQLLRPPRGCVELTTHPGL